MTPAGAELPSPLALALVSLLLGMAGAGCANSPTAPDSVRSGSLAAANNARGSIQRGESAVFSGAAAQPSASFDLEAGTFTFSTASGELTGTYTGQAVVSASRPATASLDLRVVGGTGVFQDASGELRGTGTGAFTGDGGFSLSLKGSLSLATKPGVTHVQSDILGTAGLACVNGRNSVTLQGDGTSNRFGTVSGVLSHDVSNSGCES